MAGIAPAGFQDPIAGAIDAWLPYDLDGDTLSENNSLAVFGRLRTGVSMEQALAELAVLSESAKQRWPERQSQQHRRAAAAATTSPRRRATCCNCWSSPSDSCCWSRA